jgi:predicted MFS family arabinose efflux permease
MTPKKSTQNPLSAKQPIFSNYQILVIAILAFLQFTIVLDFMILSPLGALLMDKLHVTTSQFGLVVSAYAFSAGASGLLAAGFLDRFDRKKILLLFYSGFLLGTLLCGLAPSYNFLLGARIITGIFGGVIGSICFAIIADLFKLEVRGRVMGFVQTSFAAAQILGIPLGLLLSNHFGWHAPFLMIVAVSSLVGILIIWKLQPVNAHLKLKSDRNAFQHLFKTLSRGRYLMGFAATILLSTGGFMLMPFSSAFSVHNLGISLEKLPLVYLITGISSIIAGPLVGRLSDSIGKYAVFSIGSLLGICIVIYYCHLGITPLWLVILVNVILFIAITARMISAQALSSAVPDMQDRGAFMSINASVAQISGGIASSIAGLIVIQKPDGSLGGYNILGFVVAGAMLITIGLMYNIHRMVMANSRQGGSAPSLQK